MDDGSSEAHALHELVSGLLKSGPDLVRPGSQQRLAVAGVLVSSPSTDEDLDVWKAGPKALAEMARLGQACGTQRRDHGEGGFSVGRERHDLA